MWKTVDKNVLDKRKVPATRLRARIDPTVFPFETTAEAEPLHDGIIGQERAVRAMEFGLQVRQAGYNLFVMGQPGTGKTTYARTKVAQLAVNKPTPADWCYVYNFSRPDYPLALSFPAGEGRVFKAYIDELFQGIERAIRSTFTGEEYEKQRQYTVQNFNNRAQELWDKLADKAEEVGFALERTPEGIATIPLVSGEPMSNEAFSQLSKEEQEVWEKKSRQLEQDAAETLRQVHLIERELAQTIASMNKDSARHAVYHLFQPLYKLYRDEQVQAYIKAYEENVIENYQLFTEQEKEADPMESLLEPDRKSAYYRYRVNVVVDNSEVEGAPVVFETNPSYYNLFGRMEYRSTLGTMTTDFTMIKPGALHLANGGYLIMQAGELLRNPYAWHVLKRTLKIASIQIENVAEEQGLVAASGLKPEPIPLQVKVVLIGDYDVYRALAEWDDDFSELFQVNVEFDTEMKNEQANHLAFASFVRSYGEKEGLRPFHRSALAGLIEHSARLAEDQRKLTTGFQAVTRLLVEAAFWAEQEASDIVYGQHVQKALAEQEYRSNGMDERMREMIEDGTIMVDVTGERVGQINGLAVLQIGEYAFGQPHRITAQTFIGRSGIINIERETSLSGQIHHKGLLILSGYLAGKFAQDKPLPLSASITFEQTYSMIDGDSASSTELYALLSSLSDIPIRQGIAVTGSVNQWGEIQPIGGVNEKIEGFFAVCRALGLTGEQGVIIPHQNVKNLMLRREVVEAVESGTFHIWQVRTIEEGIEILTGIEAGMYEEKTGYLDGTLFAAVNKRLERMAAVGSDSADLVIDVDSDVVQQIIRQESGK
ncbi:Lon protease family protein [Aneurinibacillus uraniidurans]|uniref:Lon protease family protein n=1 Tax=Aneurinibacillus uraniidurans TaxID=2966586 RepID=UPI00234B7D12|nr:AAA family ATPase [Aneurinibacillus sp. B1]WCN38172.1 AAA family ATPase [Aneurinibacillus sp. B1]